MLVVPDMINSGLTRWRLSMKTNGRRHGKREKFREEATDSVQVCRMGRLTRERTTEPVSQDVFPGANVDNISFMFS